MSDWYYAKDNEQKGPVNESELKAYLAANQIPPHTLVWKEGMTDWLPASQVANFTFRPPPLPAKSTTAATFSSVTASPLTFSVPGLPPVGEAVPMQEEDVEENKIFAIFSYLLILVLVPILVAPQSPFAKYHANQGLVLLILWVIVFFIVTLVNVAFASLGIPYLGAILFLAYPLHLVLVVLGIVNAASGKAAPLPVIGGIQLLK